MHSAMQMTSFITSGPNCASPADRLPHVFWAGDTAIVSPLSWESILILPMAKTATGSIYPDFPTHMSE